MTFIVAERCKEGAFDRQERIAWWSQDALRRAFVVIVGAGAIGNESAKNLALLGIGRILVCDMDAIEVSNLSRTALFRREDVGKPKATVAVSRLRELSLEISARIDSFQGDIVHSLGAGVYRRADVVLGCLDNVEARLAVNAASRRLGVPWIDAGINELDCSVAVYGDRGPCYECYRTTHDSRRFSCADFKRRVYAENKVATVQVSSALVAALQTQEAIKLLCNQPAPVGCAVSFQGSVLGSWAESEGTDSSASRTPNNPFGVYTLLEDDQCPAHVVWGEVSESPLTAGATLRELFEFAGTLGVVGAMTLDLAGDSRAFVVDACCSACGGQTRFMRPKHEMFDDDVRCGVCGKGAGDLVVNEVSSFGSDSPSEILSKPLSDLGIPPLHIVTVRGDAGQTRDIELSGDIPQVLPECSAWGPQ
jgi:adenylyltransferase/sulfurtransferase